MKHQVSDHIDQCLNSLDQVKRATAPPFFYTRLRARMDNQVLEVDKDFQLRPVFVLTLMILLLLVNTFLIFNRTPQPSIVDITEKDELQHLTYEFAVNDQFPINESYAEWTSNK